MMHHCQLAQVISRADGHSRADLHLPDTEESIDTTKELVEDSSEASNAEMARGHDHGKSFARRVAISIQYSAWKSGTEQVGQVLEAVAPILGLIV